MCVCVYICVWVCVWMCYICLALKDLGQLSFVFLESMKSAHRYAGWPCKSWTGVSTARTWKPTSQQGFPGRSEAKGTPMLRQLHVAQLGSQYYFPLSWLLRLSNKQLKGDSKWSAEPNTSAQCQLKAYREVSTLRYSPGLYRAFAYQQVRNREIRGNRVTFSLN